MPANASPQLGAAIVLVALLGAHPELSVLTWTVDSIGILRGQQTAGVGRGGVVDECAGILGGTPVRVRVDQDGSGFAELAVVWAGVPVEIWATYTAPPAPRALGTVAPAVGGR
ncbi:hypothetical protein OG322_26145 [Streptomyces sp. NBC_01260]|uniref:hypothetical protein n=1 Tax=Streptomyces sp. NBC_01260 TaxID=2903801 RepID=UPI002E2FCB00|nr:hypothetical protein [Streptomyces sp. NBC_01260]